MNFLGRPLAQGFDQEQLRVGVVLEVKAFVEPSTRDAEQLGKGPHLQVSVFIAEVALQCEAGQTEGDGLYTLLPEFVERVLLVLAHNRGHDGLGGDVLG